jgi:uncharacterized membrane protein
MQQHTTITNASLIGDAELKRAAMPRGQPIHKILVAFSCAYFAGALVTDFVYWQMPDVLWERFSVWLITAGLVAACLAVAAYVIELAGGRLSNAPLWPGVVGYTLAILLSLINAFVHSRDGYTAVVPSGLMLSATVIVVLFATARVDRAFANRLVLEHKI